MAFGKWALKMMVSIGFDTIDFIMPPGIGTIYDAIAGIVAMGLWGAKGAGAFWEIIEVTDRIDGFIPSLTIIGILSIAEIKDKEETNK